ncbi:MAG: hypothetical protein WA775_10445 [Psychroserpens sp.]|uniref:hypothetical protein n=1 Tax=Psychroserpens sp. TaxID=2020870 RepID=UPI003C7125BB
MKQDLKKIIADIEQLSNDSKLTKLQIVEKLDAHFFNERFKENLKLYKKGQKKVSDITKDLKISPRKFYGILNKKNIPHKKYNKSAPAAEPEN